MKPIIEITKAGKGRYTITPITKKQKVVPSPDFHKYVLKGPSLFGEKQTAIVGLGSPGASKAAWEVFVAEAKNFSLYESEEFLGLNEYALHGITKVPHEYSHALISSRKVSRPGYFDFSAIDIDLPYESEYLPFLAENIPSLHPVAEVLSALETETQIAELSALTEKLETLVNRHGVDGLLSKCTLQLVRDGKIGAAAALEVCSRLALKDAIPAFREALKSSNVPPLVKEIAAQRIRALPVDARERADLAMLVKAQIEGWISDKSESSARDAIPSVAFLEGPLALMWLADIVKQNSSAEIVESAADAACMVVSTHSSRGANTTEFKGFFEAAKSRLERNDFVGDVDQLVELARARLIESIGSFGAWSEHQEAAELIAQIYTVGPPLERAAAIRAAAAFVKRLGEDAGILLLRSLQKNGLYPAGRFLGLALLGRR
jgi:hypothetical protein